MWHVKTIARNHFVDIFNNKSPNNAKNPQHDPFEWNTNMVLPGLMADTGIMRWPINFPPSSKAAILREARVGRITCQRVQVKSSWMSPPTISTITTGLCLTFLKTIGSSSHTGLMALLFWEVLVFSAFLLVSAGSPNISTSMYTPTRRSVRNWPEITWKHGYKEFHVQTDKQTLKNETNITKLISF